MKFINLTAHTINETTTGREFPPSGIVARVKQSTEIVKRHDDIPLYASEFGEVVGIPEPKEGVMYIVSALTKQATDRPDVVAPGNAQRDENGDVIGCCGFRYSV